MTGSVFLACTRFLLCLFKILLSLTEKHINSYSVFLHPKYRDSIIYLRSFRKFFRDFLTRILLPKKSAQLVIISNRFLIY